MNMTISDYIDAAALYINALPSIHKSAATERNYTRILESFGDFLITREQAEKAPITAETIVSWRVFLREESEKKSNTIRQYLIVLHAFFEWALRCGKISENPVKKEEIPPPEKIKYDLLSEDEIRRVLLEEQKDNHKVNVRDRAIVTLLILSGIRSAELRALRLADVDFGEETLTIPKGKGGKSRVAPFPALAAMRLRDYLKSGDRPGGLSVDSPLFGTLADDTGHKNVKNAWKPFSSAGLHRLVASYVERLTGHGHIGTHDLRHAFASYASLSGVTTRDISLSMGHASQMTTERVYIDVLNANKAPKSVSAALNSALNALQS